MKPLSPTLVAALAIALLAAGCAGSGMQAGGPAATSQLQARSGSTAGGTVRFVQHGDHVMVHAEVTGLAPGQQHGFHIHDKGDCSAPDAMSAGGHYNPANTPHGPQNAAHHGGDMPSLQADASGKAVADFHLMGVTVADGPTSIVGRAVIVHKDPDDYKTQPTGNSGARIACGLIVKS
ncbi:superoxide dismutase family protein [Variovorax terrae]|uniref:Superoxide dismutase [Cu-Zn] n=1 Tax=Variovorax terrae TaxID=2923278 RepID=A0A9X1VSL5_9BURK|nr:superoxide dismutase family protein [Variovorax terrae]MCJ0762309.1 superoxide dismutase family protein [Variovorax terrae]